MRIGLAADFFLPPACFARAGCLPRFGLGLWNHPSACACVELILVIAGALMYGRAAVKVSKDAGSSGGLASLSAAMIAIFGLFVLLMDYTS
jgi:hypothetical protein